MTGSFCEMSLEEKEQTGRELTRFYETLRNKLDSGTEIEEELQGLKIKIRNKKWLGKDKMGNHRYEFLAYDSKGKQLVFKRWKSYDEFFNYYYINTQLMKQGNKLEF